MRILGLTAIFAWIIKAVIKIAKILLHVIAYMLLYFGLWIPAIYMIICGILMLTGGLNISVLDTNTILFYIGLALTLIGSLIISVRNLIVKPIKQIIESEKAKRELQQRKDADKRQKMYEKKPVKYFKKYEGGMPHKSHPYYDPNISRKGFIPPKVYRSNNNPSIIIHEYHNHFKVFQEYTNGDFKLIDVKEKPLNYEKDGKRYGKRK